MTNRKTRAAIAQQTLDILEWGTYTLPDGTSVSIAEALKKAKSETRLYQPDSFQKLQEGMPPPAGFLTEFRVENCTTFAAAQALVTANREIDPLCLNFASAKNPGGGFLSGSQAQEEALSRASGLYACINPVRNYYETNRHCGTALYTDHIIYSPRVPVFRDDDDQLLTVPYLTSIITAPAANAGAVQSNEPHNYSRIEPVMKQRMEYLLTIARVHQHRHLVLGAWGCGVFKNSPAQIARWFHEQLTENPLFQGAFESVIFGVLDHSPNRTTYTAFAREFS